ncbi:MAG TPA: hypothetical protein VHL09_07230 [Dehalococcoidia bacterium]|nr:hypothetical protein [Dehalococcoidia bacterium]
MNYGETIIGAARLVRRHPHLWGLGVIMTLFAGQCGGGSGFNLPGGPGGGTESGFDDGLPEPWRSLLEADPAALFGAFLLVIAIAILALIIWFIAGIIIRPIARGSIAYSVNRLSDGEPSSFGAAWGGGWRRKGALIGISLLLELLPVIVVGLVIAILVVLLFIPIIASGEAIQAGEFGAVAATLGAGVVAICCLVVIVVPIAIVLGILTELSSAASVIEGRGTGASIGRAGRLMRDRPGPIALIWLISAAIALLVGSLLAIPVFFVAFGMNLGLAATGSPPMLWIPAGLALLVVAVLAFLVNGALQAYTTSLWTLTFRALTEERGVLTAPFTG